MNAQAIKERPILFSPLLAGKVHDGSKTQTRRVVKLKGDPVGGLCKYAGKLPDGTWMWADRPPETWAEFFPPAYLEGGGLPCPYGVPGDRLFVRESISGPLPLDVEHKRFTGFYRASDPDRKVKWRPSIHMPRWACRTVVELTDVRVERVESIREEDAIAEGFSATPATQPGWDGKNGTLLTARDNFLHTFYDLNKRAPRDTNPWVWVLTFKKIESVNPKEVPSG